MANINLKVKKEALKLKNKADKEASKLKERLIGTLSTQLEILQDTVLQTGKNLLSFAQGFIKAKLDAFFAPVNKVINLASNTFTAATSIVEQFNKKSEEVQKLIDTENESNKDSINNGITVEVTEDNNILQEAAAVSVLPEDNEIKQSDSDTDVISLNKKLSVAMVEKDPASLETFFTELIGNFAEMDAAELKEWVLIIRGLTTQEEFTDTYEILNIPSEYATNVLQGRRDVYSHELADWSNVWRQTRNPVENAPFAFRFSVQQKMRDYTKEIDTQYAALNEKMVQCTSKQFFDGYRVGNHIMNINNKYSLSPNLITDINFKFFTQDTYVKDIRDELKDIFKLKIKLLNTYYPIINKTEIENQIYTDPNGVFIDIKGNKIIKDINKYVVSSTGEIIEIQE